MKRAERREAFETIVDTLHDLYEDLHEIQLSPEMSRLFGSPKDYRGVVVVNHVLGMPEMMRIYGERRE